MTDDTPTLRQTERDLFVAAKELREDIEDAKARREELREEVRALDDDAEMPDEWEAEYRDLKDGIEDDAGTAETYEHYAEEWSADGDSCVFVLEELNGDEYAATVDAVNSEAVRGNDKSIPEGFARVKALEFGVGGVPEGCPPTPGVWPAPVVDELFSALQEITAPSGVDLGNESLASVRETSAGDTDTDTDDEQTATPSAK